MPRRLCNEAAVILSFLSGERSKEGMIMMTVLP
jgi:hypothetical protein